MPESPNNRARNSAEHIDQPNVNSSDDSNRPRSKSSRRLQKQNLKARYAKLREEAQLAGLIETVPSGAVRNERVDKNKQSEQEQPGLVEKAIKSGWAVPEEKKPKLVEEMVRITESEETSEKTKVAAFRALLTADQQQYERDNPQVKKSGGQVNVSVQTNIAAVDVLRQALSKEVTPLEVKDKE